MRRNVVVAVVTLAVLAVIVLFAFDPFGDDDSAALEDVVVNEGDNPTLTVDEPVVVETSASRVVKEGEGNELEVGNYFRANYLVANGEDGSLMDSSFPTGQSALFEFVDLNEAASPQQIPGLPSAMIDELEGTPVGSTVLVAVTAEEFFGDLVPQSGFEADDSLIFYFHLEGSADVSEFDDPSGDPAALPEGVPVPQIDGDSVTGFDGSAAAPTGEYAAHVVIAGSGDVVEADEGIVVNYVGQVYPDGTVFDSSWERGERAVFQIGVGGVITCWDEQLVGQPAGTRVVLTCPADVAYGDNPAEGGPIAPGDTLTFAVDVLGSF